MICTWTGRGPKANPGLDQASDRNANECRSISSIARLPLDMGLTTAVVHESGQSDYSEDEIEQILGMGAPEARFALEKIRETIRENPFVVTGLVLAFGILIGISLGCGRKR